MATPCLADLANTAALAFLIDLGNVTVATRWQVSVFLIYTAY